MLSLAAVAAAAMLTGGTVAQASPLAVDARIVQVDDGSSDEGSSSDDATRTESELERGDSEQISDPGPEEDLACERGCVLEYHACMWSEWSLSCEGALDQCSATCS